MFLQEVLWCSEAVKKEKMSVAETPRNSVPSCTFSGACATSDSFCKISDEYGTVGEVVDCTAIEQLNRKDRNPVFRRTVFCDGGDEFHNA